MEWFMSQSPVLQAFIAGIFTWFCTLVGSLVVFFVKEFDKKLLSIMQGAAAGVMTAASFWSLLSPALDFADKAKNGLPAWFPVTIGFLFGGIFLRLLDKFIPHIHPESDHGDADDNPAGLGKSTMLFLAVTIHNFPEGMALGVAFAAAGLNLSGATMAGALALTMGIGIQNIPEGSALALPIRAQGKGKIKAFNMAQMSALIEPVGAILGAAAVTAVTAILPYALSFAAGAMMFVVIEELVPESQSSNFTDLATMSFLFGFVIMMVLDVALG